MDGSPAPFLAALRAPRTNSPVRAAVTQVFTGADIADVRALVRAAGAAAGVAPDELDNLLIAVSEIATNAIRHGSAMGSVTVEHLAAGLTVEISDDGGGLPDGLVVDRPPADAVGGRGLWLAHQMCPRIEVTSSPSGVTVRLAVPGGTPELIT
jgi:anti-sigma regulatory factor (Ser/Thr protein kinase)